MEPKSPFSRIAAAAQPVAATTASDDVMRRVLAQAILEREIPLAELFAQFAQSANDPQAGVSAEAQAAMERLAARVALQVPPQDVTARGNTYPQIVRGALEALWRRSMRPGMTPDQAAEVAISVLAAGATSALEPRR
jgi:hypothetical protein